MAGLSELVVAFGRALRASGLDAPVSSVVCFAQALELLGLARPDQVFWAGHASFVRRPEESQVYATAFAAFFTETSVPGHPSIPSSGIELLEMLGESSLEDATPERDSAEVVSVSYSPAEILKNKDFAACSDEEIVALRRLMASMRFRSPRRTTRRKAPVRGSGGSPDLRRTVRRALRSGGEPVRLCRLGPGDRERPVVLLVDLSGSMDPYARPFLFLAHALVAGGRRVEAFAIGTRLTRITRELSWRDPDGAIFRTARSVPDISGGTRLGEGLRCFNDSFGVAGLARGAVVVILSDGWDRGDPKEIAGEMSRLRRVAHRVIWVNPLKATPGYEPLARGMAAALPYLDLFLEGNTLVSLERLVDSLAS